MMTPSHWNRLTLGARIQNLAARQRYSAGSPDATEMVMYEKALPADCDGKTAVVLGMTPELRSLAVRYFKHVIAIDANPDAIEMYRDWLGQCGGAAERIICANWLDLRIYLSEPVDVVLCDGAFGNLPDLQTHYDLLGTIRQSLRPGGKLITRHAMIPYGFDSASYDAMQLLARYRHGSLDQAEFAFGVRLLGHYHCCYDPTTFQLNNRKLFAECHAAWQAGLYSDDEHRLILRYYFGGNNTVLPQRCWEEILAEVGFGSCVHACQGKDWYQYYQVYECVRR